MHLGWSDEAAMIRVKLSEPVAERSSSCNVFGGGTFGVARAKMPIKFPRPEHNGAMGLRRMG